MTAARAFAAAGLGLAIVGAVGTVLVRYGSPAPLISSAFGFGGVAMVGYLIGGLAWASMGALLVIRRPGNAVGWLMVLVGVGFALSQLSISLASMFAAEGTAEGQRLAQVAAWVTVLLQLVGVFQVAIGFLFPGGRAQSRGWARFIRIVWAFAIVFTVVSLTQPGPLQLVPALQNPFGFGPDLRGDRPIAPIFIVLGLVILVGLGASMAQRYRSAGLVERLQLKWFVTALGADISRARHHGLRGDLSGSVCRGDRPHGLRLCRSGRPGRDRASRSCATTSSTSNGSSAGRSAMRWSPPCWRACSGWQSCRLASSSAHSGRGKRSRWLVRPCSSRHCSARCGDGLRRSSTAASTDRALTPP